jgi:hypothetical protein
MTDLTETGQMKVDMLNDGSTSLTSDSCNADSVSARD